MESKNYRQMREALEEIRAKAGTMTNGGAWAAGMAVLCLGTLDPNEHEIAESYYPPGWEEFCGR
jgi:hypothetical protein